MKPKKGESNAEMDEPIKSPLQLVKEFVLLIVEARTPDLSVKGRIEGPHCPAVRGRQVHKCSKDKVECARASEICSLAQRLWLNGIPVCLDTLLFPDCERGREEAALTEGAVTKLSAETALLLERWTIDGSRRRQDDCLSSSMVIQALRSYLHFSQISSWLYSMGGKLPGVIAYRIYAPGEVTGLDFNQQPDHHCFPACSINFQHIRVRVSSLQRQASVPKLVCHCERGHGAFSRGVEEKESNNRKHTSKASKGSRLDTKVQSLPRRSFQEQEVAAEGSGSYNMAKSTGEGCYASLKQLNDCRYSMTGLPSERIENPVCHHSRPYSAAPPSLSMCVTGTDSYSSFLEQMYHGQMLLSESEVTAKKAQELNKMNMFDDDCCLSVEEQGSVCQIRTSTGVPLVSSFGTKSQAPGLVADEMTSLYCLSDLSLTDVATTRDSAVGQGDCKVQDWRLNSFSDARREPAGMTKTHLVDGGCDNVKMKGYTPGGICMTHATEDDRFKFSEMKSVAVPMKRRRPKSENEKIHYPAIGKEWFQNRSTSHLKEDSSNLVNKNLPVSLMDNCNSSAFEENVLFQLTDRVSCWPYFLEDSDDTPVASPSQTPQANIAAEYFAQIQPEYVKSKLNHHFPQNNSSKVLSDDTQKSSSLLQRVKSSSLSHSRQQPETKSTSFVQGLQPGNIDFQSVMSDKGHSTKKTLENENDVSDPDFSQSTCRRIFQEKSLPLVSYDADSDSFKNVEVMYKSKLLHSPKVLFSCDLPAAQTSCYKKCIDFDDSFEAELFNSKMGDMVNPEFIGRYMSNLATLSCSPIDSYNNITTDDANEDLFSNHTKSDFLSQQNNVDLWQKSSTECSNYTKAEENSYGDIKKPKSFNSVVKDSFCDDLKDSPNNPCGLKPARRQLYEPCVEHVHDPCTQLKQNKITNENVFKNPVNKLCKLEGIHNKVLISRHLEPDQVEENVPLWVKGLQPKCSSAVGPRTSLSLTGTPILLTSATIDMFSSLGQRPLKEGESAQGRSAAVKSPLDMGVDCSQEILVSDVTEPISANSHSSLSESLPLQIDVRNTNCDINCSNCFSNIPVPHSSVESLNLDDLPTATPTPRVSLPDLCNEVIISPYLLHTADQRSPKSHTQHNVTSISSDSQPLDDQPSKTFPAAITPICDTSLNSICTQTVQDPTKRGHLPTAAQNKPAPDTHSLDHVCQHAAQVSLVIPANPCDNQSSLSDGQNSHSHLNAGLTCGFNSRNYQHATSPQTLSPNVSDSEGERSACHVYCNGNSSEFAPDLPIFNKGNPQELVAQTVVSTTQCSVIAESSELVNLVRNKSPQNCYSQTETKLISSKKFKTAAKESDTKSCKTDLVTTAVSSVDPKVQCDHCLVDQQSGVSSEVSGFSPSNDSLLVVNHPESNHNVIFYLSESEPSADLDTQSLELSGLLTFTDSAELVNKPSISKPARLPLVILDSQSSPDLTGRPGLNYVHVNKKPSPAPEASLVAMDQEMPCCDKRSSPPMSGFQQQHCDHPVLIGLKRATTKSSPSIFNSRTGLPTQSSPAPLKRKSGGKFDYDVNLLSARAIKSAFSCSKLASSVSDDNDASSEDDRKTLSTSAPASTNCLLGNFEESVLNGRIDPVGAVDGFTAEIGASGTFCPKHIHLPVTAFFFALSDDNAPSPYLGHISLDSAGRKGYHIPKKGTVQVTLFNPNKTVVKMFVVVYDFTDMPASSQTFIRQRTVYSPTDKNVSAPSYLRYLIHLRCASSHSGKIYLHTDIRLIFARNKLDIDAKTIPYELKSYTEFPQNPKYSPKK